MTVAAKREIWVNMVEIWDNNITDAIEDNKDYIDFSIMPYDEFKEECFNLISYYFDNDMLGNEINYNNLVLDTAKDYDMLMEG